MALTTSLMSLLSVLLARLLGLIASGVVSMLLGQWGAEGVWSKKLSPLVLSPLVLSPLVLSCREKVSQPGCGGGG